MDEFQWIRDIVPTKVYEFSDEREAIELIRKKTIMMMGHPVIQELNVEYGIVKDLWDQSGEALRKVQIRLNDIVIDNYLVQKTWRFRYTTCLLIEHIAFYMRNNDRIAWDNIIITIRSRRNNLVTKLYQEFKDQ